MSGNPIPFENLAQAISDAFEFDGASSVNVTQTADGMFLISVVR